MDTEALRQKILDLAIRGKLVPQDLNDEPASVLLEKICAEKQRMLEEGTLKAKDVKNDTVIFRGEDNLHYEQFRDGTVKCIEEEIPFEVPERWAWSRLQSITSILTDGTHKTPIYSERGYIFLSSKNVTSGKIDWDNTMYIPETLHQELYSRLAPKIGDILLAKNGTTGIAAIVDKEEIFDIYVSLALIRIFENIIEPLYVLTAIGSSYVQDYFNDSLKGIGVPNLHLEHIRKTLIPIPPYSEQVRIALRLDMLIPLTEQIEEDKKELEHLASALKSKILDLAICGQLVSQNPDDEPVSVLLERIRAEKEELIKQGKIKRDKKESIIFKGDDNSYFEKIDGDVRCIDQELPFEIPYSWMFVRLKHIGSIVGGGTPKTTIPQYWNGDIPWLTPADFSGYEEIYISHGERNITMAGLNSSSAQLLPVNTVLYSSRAPIGYVAIASNDITTNQGFKSIIPIDTNMSIYIYFTLKARTDNIIMRATGTTFKEISGYEMGETFIPLPPLNEQKRIYEKILQLSNFILIIEKSLS